MKAKRPKPKQVRAIRLSDSMWAEIQNLAYANGMRPSEFIRRVLERELLQHAGKLVKEV